MEAYDIAVCDGFGHQVCFGIAEELLKLSITYGAEGRYPENWLDGVGTKTENEKRYAVQYNAQLFAILAEKLLLESGVVLLHRCKRLSSAAGGCVGYTRGGTKRKGKYVDITRKFSNADADICLSKPSSDYSLLPRQE